MKTIGVYNIKGGVGKTATAVNLAYLAAQSGKRTLVWDLDPQAAATFYFRVKPRVKGGSRKLLRRKVDLDSAIKGTDYPNLDLLPADFSYRNMDLQLDDARKPVAQLARLLRPLATEFDYLFLDCPPSISLLSENVFRAADALLIPTLPSTLSVRTYEQLLAFFQANRIKSVQCLPFFSMVDRRRRMHLEVLSSMPERFPEMLSSEIPYAAEIEEMGIHRQPLPGYAERSSAATAYRALWDEVVTRLSPGVVGVGS